VERASYANREPERHTENRGAGGLLWKNANDLSILTVPAPAKINLFLAVTGRRPDGFHDLLSVAAPLLWGDSIAVEARDASFSVACDDPEVPSDGSNLVIKAAAAFAEATGWEGGAHFTVSKKIPVGAGLGGASSDATSALVALNTMARSPLDGAGLARVASQLGSDCALFLSGGPVVMRGRGERVEPLPKEAYRRVRGMRVLIFKPGVPVSTAWAYGRLAAGSPQSYVPGSRAEATLNAWISRSGAPAEQLQFNSMEPPVFAKFPALPILLEEIRRRFNLSARMSGSGSACYVLLTEDADPGPVCGLIREAWGPSAFIVETRIA
jgi:4-diphosphocytidyl-2-C-methyl-D-erythritol kinase